MSQTKEIANDGFPGFDRIQDVLESVRLGACVLVVDDERRENEGDLICAAEMATPQAIHFMAARGKGLICLAMEKLQADKLGLSRMPRRGTVDKFDTAFLESVDAAEGVTTGISSDDRVRTIQACIHQAAQPSDVRIPGHVFPLEAMKGGVLERPGHTEAAIDLARLAGLKPAGVICEVIRDDGEMARLPDLIEFAKEENLKIISVADLIAYRQQTETLIEPEEEITLPTRYGEYRLRMYRSKIDDAVHLALIMGDPHDEEAPLVRVHSECFTGDVLGSLRCDCGDQLDEALRAVADEGHGVILYMKQEGRGIGLPHKIKAYALQEKGMDTVEANEHLGLPADLRDYAISAQMLTDIGIHQCRLLTNNPDKITGLNRYGITITERIPLQGATNPHNARYLATKKDKMGHLI